MSARKTPRTSQDPEKSGLNLVLPLLSEADQLTTFYRQRHGEILRKVGMAMRAERERATISLKSLAAELKLSPRQLSAMERGTKKYTTEWCKKAIRAIDELTSPPW